MHFSLLFTQQKADFLVIVNNIIHKIMSAFASTLYFSCSRIRMISQSCASPINNSLLLFFFFFFDSHMMCLCPILAIIKTMKPNPKLQNT